MKTLNVYLIMSWTIWLEYWSLILGNHPTLDKCFPEKKRFFPLFLGFALNNLETLWDFLTFSSKSSMFFKGWSPLCHFSVVEKMLFKINCNDFYIGTLKGIGFSKCFYHRPSWYNRATTLLLLTSSLRYDLSTPWSGERKRWLNSAVWLKMRTFSAKVPHLDWVFSRTRKAMALRFSALDL